MLKTKTNLVSRRSSISGDPSRRIVGQMKETCPDIVDGYARCITMHQRRGTLDHKTCQMYLDSVKRCFVEMDCEQR